MEPKVSGHQEENEDNKGPLVSGLKRKDLKRGATEKLDARVRKQ